MPSATDRLAALRERLALSAHLGQVSSLLSWDEATYMPPGGAEARGQQAATLARLRHEQLDDPGLVDLVEELEGVPLRAEDAALLRETRRLVDRARRVPADLVAAMASQSVRGRGVWAAARAADDFGAFAPALRAAVDLARAHAGRSTMRSRRTTPSTTCTSAIRRRPGSRRSSGRCAAN